MGSYTTGIYTKFRDALEQAGVFQRIEDETGSRPTLTMSAGTIVNDSSIQDIAWLEPGMYLTIQIKNLDDVEALAALICRPDQTLRQRVLAVAAEVVEAEDIDEEVSRYYRICAAAVSACLDYASTFEEAEVLQGKIEHLQGRLQNLRAGLRIHDQKMREETL